jgi:hypothetical protein
MAHFLFLMSNGGAPRLRVERPIIGGCRQMTKATRKARLRRSFALPAPGSRVNLRYKLVSAYGVQQRPLLLVTADRFKWT